jgi:hypothetical protein
MNETLEDERFSSWSSSAHLVRAQEVPRIKAVLDTLRLIHLRIPTRLEISEICTLRELIAETGIMKRDFLEEIWRVRGQSRRGVR